MLLVARTFSISMLAFHSMIAAVPPLRIPSPLRCPSVPKPALLIVPDQFRTPYAGVEALRKAGGGSLFIRKGEYVIDRALRIDFSGVSVIGEPGTILALKDSVNHPIISIGTDAEIPLALTEDIRIEGLTLDGNMEAQQSEFDAEKPWIRNNGIDIRKAMNVDISGVVARNARSGGLVVSWGCSRIKVRDCAFQGNFFDGLALYDSKDIQVSQVHSFANHGAGLSLDNGLERVLFNGGILSDNRDGGIFVRHSASLVFQGLLISGNRYGAFLADEPSLPGSGVKRLFFSGCSFEDNVNETAGNRDHWGIFLASPKPYSEGTTVSGCRFSNSGEAIKVSEGAELLREGNIILP